MEAETLIRIPESWNSAETFFKTIPSLMIGGVWKISLFEKIERYGTPVLFNDNIATPGKNQADWAKKEVQPIPGKSRYLKHGRYANRPICPNKESNYLLALSVIHSVSYNKPLAKKAAGSSMLKWELRCLCKYILISSTQNLHKNAMAKQVVGVKWRK